jgi:hypothetical protein
MNGAAVNDVRVACVQPGMALHLHKTMSSDKMATSEAVGVQSKDVFPPPGIRDRVGDEMAIGTVLSHI